MWNLIIIVAVILAPLFLLLPMMEKAHLAGDLEPATSTSPCFDEDYLVERRAEAGQLGLSPLGDFTTRKDASIVKGTTSYWAPDDRLFLLEIVSCEFHGARLRKSVLHTLLVDETAIVTTDESYAQDLSGKTHADVLLNADLHELVHRHLVRIEPYATQIKDMRFDNVLAFYESMQMTKGRRLVEGGIAKWANREQTQTRYTLKGCLLHFYRSLFLQAKELSKQSERTSIPRVKGSRK